MRTFRYFATICLILTSCLSAFGGKNDNWTLHPTFDADIKKIVASERMVYFMPYAQRYMPSVPENSEPLSYLYRYDTAKEEFHHLSAFNILSETLVKDIKVNSKRGYLMVIYNSGNIDLLFDKGKVMNVPGLMNANIPGSKNINSVTFDHSRRRAYLSTDFGVVSINDDKGEMAESHNFGKKLLSFARLGPNYLAVDDTNHLFYTPVSSPLFSFDEFSILPGSGEVTALYPLTEDIMILAYTHMVPDEENPEILVEMTQFSSLVYGENGEPVYTQLQDVNASNVEMNSRGYIVNTPTSNILISRNGTMTSYGVSSSDKNAIIGSWDFKEYWYGKDREGFYSKELRDGQTVVTREMFAPNASATFKCSYLKYHPTYGMLTSNHGNDFYFQSESCRTPILLSGLKNGGWIKYGPPYTYPSHTNVLRNPNGLAVDPNYPDYVYFGSLLSGIVRLNLKNPSDILHMSGPNDSYAYLKGFAIICEAQESWENMNRFSAPEFDSNGNLWAMHTNLNSASSRQNEIWVWPRANSAATKDHTDVKPWIKLIPTTSGSSNVSIVLPLKHQSNKNLVLVSLNNYQGEMLILDHNGTLDNASDDKYTTLPLRPVDQDGQTVNRLYIRCLYEDPATGLVWVGTDSGVFTFNPRTAQQQPNLVNRIKVARNDGTSLADYLLNGVDIFNISADSQGRKWFSTYGAGLVCTSSDGRTVIEEYTTDNSGIPSNEVYAAEWNPDNSTIMVSTSLGLAEVAPYGEGSGEDLSSARAYPNPVRPDYYGWVTIDGLVANSLVKIVDADGNVIRELGNAQGGKVEWDICDATLKRAKSGVYYVLASVDADNGNMAKVAKLLVVN